MDNIIIGYAASEKLEGSAWGVLCDTLKYMAHDEAKTFLRTQEAAFKLEYGPIPNAYRSAKSVCLTALKRGISLEGSNGLCKGKTQVQTEIKESNPKEVEDPVADAIRHMGAIVQLYAEAGGGTKALIFDTVQEGLSVMVSVGVGE